jgi:6-phosphofructokinase
MAAAKTILVGQSGGPTAAINSSLAGVLEAGRDQGANVIGMRYGIQGLMDGRIVDLNKTLPNPSDVELLRATPSSYLGSCRYKLPEASVDQTPYQQLFERFSQLGATAVLYIGGNDSMDTIAKLSAYGAEKGSPIRFIGVPKTIDNDLVGTDHTPGYGSAAKFIATTLHEISCDSNVYDLKSVTFVEIMGRDAGWLAASASLARTDGDAAPDLVLLPEVPLTEEALLQRLSQLLAVKNTIVVAVSEGVRRPDGTLICEHAAGSAGGAGVDAFGHVAALSGTSRYLASLTKEKLGCKTRAVELSTVQRCASHMASATDLNEAFALGGLGVLAAADGKTGMMCALKRNSDLPYSTQLDLVDVQSVANKVRNVPAQMISEDGMNVTDAFVRYARPLIMGEPAVPTTQGVPRHLEPLA